MTQAAAPPPQLALMGVKLNPPRQPQEESFVDKPHAEIKINPQLKPRGGVAIKDDPNVPTSSTSCRLNPHDQLCRLCVYGIRKSSIKAITTKIQTQSSADTIPTSLSPAHQKRNKQKQTNKQKNPHHKTHPMQSLHKQLDQP